MTTKLSSIRSLHGLSLMLTAALFMIFVGAATPSVGALCKPLGDLPGACKPIPAPAPVENDDVCSTLHTNIAVKNGIVSVFSGKRDSNANGFLVTEISLKSIRAVTDDEKASGERITLLAKKSEFANGWSVQLYWFDNHYGVVVTGEGGFYDDTGDCVSF